MLLFLHFYFMIYWLKEAIYLSETATISPLLDGFSVGSPISEHNGIRCCPAIKENTDKKYIVKIISVPASQVQMDALLLAGAYKDPADVMEYFRQNGEDILKEAELLKKLSKLDGFLAYEAWQMMPITRRRLGYEIYLVGSYKRSLDKYVKKNPVTCLEAINLGLDLCAALSVCRQAGSLYVDLKPTNIFVSDKKDYRIGDLGFISLDALSYTALPDKYHSPYTPPELFDPMASVNLSADCYAVGMILYQLYNDGQLPFKGQAPEEALPSPVNADYELAEIIMKAIHPDPEQRWQDPKDMGKALASYLQRNVVNDVPITHHTPLVVDPEDTIQPAVKQPESDTSDTVETESEETEVSATLEDIPDEEALHTDTEDTSIEEEASEACAEVTEFEEEVEADTEVSIQDESSEEETACADSSEEQEKEPKPEEPQPISVAEDSFPEESVLPEELAQIFAKADDLISHETPDGVSLPEMPEEPDPFGFIEEDPEAIDDSDIPLDPVMEDEEEQPLPKQKHEQKFIDPKYKRRRKRFLSTFIFLLIACVIGTAGYWYYQNYYLQPIDSISLDGGQDHLTVSVSTPVDEALLRVTCSDNYGKVTQHSLSNGTAVITGLQPDTMYRIELEIDGFHKLVGKTSDVFTTEATTNIVSFTAVGGAEDGSVVLNFTVDGEEPDKWSVHYSAEGEAEKTESFTGHSVSISGLTLGKIYTFTLDAGNKLSLGGEKTLEAMATRLILAENLTVTSENGTDVTVHWNAPGDVVIDSWDVRCYNNAGYEEQMTVTECQISIPNINTDTRYTIEVTASGMTQPARTNITANPININALNVNTSDHAKFNLSWDHTGEKPEDGWLLMYSIDGGEKSILKCDKAQSSVTPRIPGAAYEFTIQAADGTSVFNNTHMYTSPAAEDFNKHNLKMENLAVDLLKTPEEENWYYENIDNDALTNTFTVGDSISIVLRSESTFYLPGASLDILYVIRDSYGNVLPGLVSEESGYWKDLWEDSDAKNGELTLPKVPDNAGSYVLHLYFDGMTVAEIPFTITN